LEVHYVRFAETEPFKKLTLSRLVAAYRLWFSFHRRMSVGDGDLFLVKREHKIADWDDIM
jgi:hypothetical protein